MDEQYLVSISDDEDSHSDSYSISNGTSSVEISSTIDEYENLSTYLHLESEFNDDNNGQDFEWPQPPSPLSSCSSSSI